MRLHTSVIDKLVHLYETYGGHRNESKLRSMLAEVNLSVYKRTSSGEEILVPTDLLEAETTEKIDR